METRTARFTRRCIDQAIQLVLVTASGERLDQPRDRRAVLPAGGHPHPARARRADGVGPAHRQGHGPRGLVDAEQYSGPEEPEGANGAGSFNGSTELESVGNGHKTFSGAGFGTLMMQLSAGPKATPPVASTRASLHNAVPS